MKHRTIIEKCMDMKMRSKFILMLSLPLLGMLYFSGSEIINRYQIGREMKDVVQLSDLASRTSNAIHELQKERGRTAGYLGASGQKFSSELADQRRETDAKLAVLNDYLDTFDARHFGREFETILGSATSNLQKLDLIRSDIITLKLSTGDAIGYYVSTIGNYIDVFGFISGLTASAEASNKILTTYNLIQAKERAGIERAVLSNTFSANAFGPGMYEKFISLIAAQEAFLAGFETTASDEHSELLGTKMKDKSVAEVERMRQIAKEQATEGNFNIDAGLWFATITSKINLFKEVEDELSLDLAAFTTAGAAEAQRAVIIFSLLGLIAIIGSIGISMVISQSILKCLERIAYIMGKVSSGILTEKLELEIDDELGDVGKAIDLMITNLSELITSLRGSATQVGEASNSISSASEQLAAGSEEQQAQLSEVASTMEEMSAMILESSNNAGDTLTNAQKTDDIAESGRESVMKTVTGFKAVANTVETASYKIQELSKRSEEIGSVIQVIDDIADQTNLLALNANIEAARAGDAGRGFAVVADEVRKLAERTVAATAEIGNMVESIQGDIKEAVGSMEGIQEQSHNGLALVTEAENSLNSIAAAMKVSVKAVEQIATATNEQSSGAEEISKNVEGVSTVAKESASSAQALATSAEQLNHEVDGLNELVAQFEV